MSTLPPPVYFGGLDLGLTGEFRRGPWTLEWLSKVAVGPSRGAVDVSGATTATVPGFAPQTSAGGLLALSSNSGHFDRNRVAVVPELGVKLGYQLTLHFRATVGYDFLYWNNVVRRGGPDRYGHPPQPAAAAAVAARRAEPSRTPGFHHRRLGARN
jgi:Putative beta barrel porin-7 (BBP7)